jgi:hypothetical protein
LESILGLFKSLKIRALALTIDVEGGRLPEEADEIVTLIPETQLTSCSRRCKLCPSPAKNRFYSNGSGSVKALAKTTGQKCATAA